MKRFSYDERDYTFGQTILTLRTAIGLTQAGLAEILGILRRAVSEWEAGSSYPKTKHLKQLIEIGVQQQTFPSGREAEEIHLLWQAAHQKVLLDEQWLAALLEPSHPANGPTPTRQHQPQFVEATDKEARLFLRERSLSQPNDPLDHHPSSHHPLHHQRLSRPRVDWGDALAIPTFYGREQELAQLVQWTVQEHCHVVSVLGMGGIGKSALSIMLMHQATNHFEVVLFRSLRDAPSCEDLLDDV